MAPLDLSVPLGDAVHLFSEDLLQSGQGPHPLLAGQRLRQVAHDGLA